MADEAALFDGESLSSCLGAKLRAVSGVVENIAQEVFMVTSTEALVTQVVDQLTMVPLVLHLDQLQTEQSATRLSRMVWVPSIFTMRCSSISVTPEASESGAEVYRERWRGIHRYGFGCARIDVSRCSRWA